MNQPKKVKDAVDRLDEFYNLIDQGFKYDFTFKQVYKSETHDWDLVDKDQEIVCRWFLDKTIDSL